MGGTSINKNHYRGWVEKLTTKSVCGYRLLAKTIGKPSEALAAGDVRRFSSFRKDHVMALNFSVSPSFGGCNESRGTRT
jgi:hypothetical protein